MLHILLVIKCFSAAGRKGSITHVPWNGRLIEAPTRGRPGCCSILLVRLSPSPGFYIALKFGTVINVDIE